MIKNLYNKYCLPKLLDVCCSTKPISYQRNKIIPYAKGVVLEIGIGSGLNLPYYKNCCIDKLYGLDPSEELHELAIKNSKKNNLDVDFLINGAEEIHLPNNYVDTVVITYTLCTISMINESLSEIKRVLKDDGKILFCEHGKAPDSQIELWQNRINPLWGKFFGGCNINRDIPKLILAGDFRIKKLDQMYIPGTPKIVGYNYWGVATN